jgi:cytochrome c553
MDYLQALFALKNFRSRIA